MSLILFSVPGVCLPYHCVGKDIERMEKATSDANEALKIERSEFVGLVDYQIRAKKVVAGEEVTAVWFRFGFDAHPGGSVPVRYFETKEQEIEIPLGSFTKGVRGCVDIVYGQRCGALPQVVITYEKAYLNETNGTVYCGFRSGARPDVR